MKLPTQVLLITATLIAFSSAHAQPGSPVTTLSPYLVRDVPVEASINPLTRKTAAVIGDERDLLSTPRAVSELTVPLFNERQIHGVRESSSTRLARTPARATARPPCRTFAATLPKPTSTASG